MKNFLLTVAALATAVVSMAQTMLNTSQTLPRHQKAATTVAKAATESDYDETQANYFRLGESLENQFGDIDTKGHVWGGNPLKITFPADGASGKVVIQNLLDYDDYYAKVRYDITGDYDADARTVTIETPFSNTGIGRAVRISDISYNEDVQQLVLVSCEVSNRADQTGNYPIYINDELVFDVADDGTLTAQTQWLAYGFGQMSQGIFRIYNTTEIHTITEAPQIAARPATVDFPFAMVGMEQKEQVYVANMGRTAANMEYNVTGDELLQFAAKPLIQPVSNNKFIVMCTPAKDGNFNGLIQMRDNETETIVEINVTGSVEPKPDFSEVVKQGDFEFSLPHTVDDYLSFRIIDHDGRRVAKCDMNELGISGVLGKFEVPENQVAVLSYRGINHAEQPNGFYGILDGEFPAFYNDLYDAKRAAVTEDWPVYAITGCKAGQHEIEIDYLRQIDWTKQGAPEQWGCFYDLSLECMPETAHAGFLIDEQSNFGALYRDRYAARSQQTVQILNMGTENLTVTGSKGSENFKAVVDGSAVPQFGKLPVMIQFIGETVGDYDETLTIETNAGEFNVNCKATVSQLPYDYTPIVKQGEFSFDTSDPWPFTVDDATKEASSSNYVLGGEFDGVSYSWLAASFVVPENETGVLSWQGYNSSSDLFTFMGQTVLTDGTMVYIDGNAVAMFGGECEAGSADVDEQYLTLPAGYHTLKFQFQKKNSEPDGECKVSVWNLGLSLTTAGIYDVNNANEVVSTAYYNLKGVRLDAPAKGVNLVRMEKADGTIVVKKVRK